MNSPPQWNFKQYQFQEVRTSECLDTLGSKQDLLSIVYTICPSDISWVDPSRQYTNQCEVTFLSSIGHCNRYASFSGYRCCGRKYLRFAPMLSTGLLSMFWITMRTYHNGLRFFCACGHKKIALLWKVNAPYRIASNCFTTARGASSSGFRLGEADDDDDDADDLQDDDGDDKDPCDVCNGATFVEPLVFLAATKNPSEYSYYKSE